MVDEFALFKSRELANIVRYSEDKHDKSLGLQPSSLDNVTDEFYRSAVEINGNLTPNIETAFQKVCERLSLERLPIARLNSTSLARSNMSDESTKRISDLRISDD